MYTRGPPRWPRAGGTNQKGQAKTTDLNPWPPAPLEGPLAYPADKQINRQTERHTDRETDRQMDRIKRQTDTQTERNIDSHTQHR